MTQEPIVRGRVFRFENRKFVVSKIVKIETGGNLREYCRAIDFTNELERPVNRYFEAISCEESGFKFRDCSDDADFLEIYCSLHGIDPKDLEKM